MVQFSTGIDFLRLSLRVALGESVVLDGLPPYRCVAYHLMVQAPDEFTKITAVEGLDQLKEVGKVDEIILNRRPGESVDWRDGNYGAVFIATGYSPDHDTFRALLRYIYDHVVISGE